MAGYYKGSVRQMTSDHGLFEKASSQPFPGNEIKHSSISEMDIELDTSRFHISLPISGKELYQVDGKDYAAQENEYFIFHPKQSVRAAGKFEKSVEGICIFLSPATIGEVAKALTEPLEASLEHPFNYTWQQHEFMVKTYGLQENTFGQYLAALRRRLLHPSKDQVVDWVAFYYELATEFLKAHRQIGQHLQAIPSARTLTKQEIYRRLSLAHCYILDKYAEPVTLEDLEQVAFFSKYHLVRLYRQIYGLTPHQHILQLRVERAKELLRKGCSPTEVALMLSFSDRRAFGKVFKKAVGVSPMGFVGK
ncbi:MAG: AraC family transcriptional regulator [Saprospiraceae bacterium]